MRYHEDMRTTLEIDDDVIGEAKRLARERGVSVGHVISDLARKTLTNGEPPKYRNGFRQLEPKPGAPRADLELVNRLRDEE
jgi:hypothetical protein